MHKSCKLRKPQTSIFFAKLDTYGCSVSWRTDSMYQISISTFDSETDVRHYGIYFRFAVARSDWSTMQLLGQRSTRIYE